MTTKKKIIDQTFASKLVDEIESKAITITYTLDKFCRALCNEKLTELVVLEHWNLPDHSYYVGQPSLHFQNKIG